MVIMLILDTGMRLGECSCLFVEEVDLNKKRIYEYYRRIYE